MDLAQETSRAVLPPQAITLPPPAAATTPYAKHEAKTSAVDPKEEQKKLTEKEAHKLIREVNEHLAATHTELNFSVDKDTDQMVLKIINTKTDEVIRQIPSEDALRLASRISQLLGVLVDGKS
jgi:flagellar protein FlaG